MSSRFAESYRIPLSTMLRQVLLLFPLMATVAVAQDKPEVPRIAVAVPFAIPANATTKVVVRGWKLNRDLEAKSTIGGVTFKVIRRDNAPIPNGQDAKQIGDTLVELEITVPAGFSSASLPIRLFAGEMESTEYTLLVGGRDPVVSEIEPNDGFRQAQAIAIPQIVDGQLHADRNVDVYAVNLGVPQKLLVEIIARRQGSGLDSLLTIFDAKGNKIDSNDDAVGADSRIEIPLAAGPYWIVIQDANDHGGPAHPYRLVVQSLP